MKILVLNGSPKGDNSITVQTLKYLEAINPNHQFNYLNIGQQIHSLEKDFSKVITALNDIELVIFSYPVYTFICPAPVHRFIELMQEHHIDLSNKFVTQVTTSKHFFDSTAHKYLHENIIDLNGKYLRGLAADMDDLLSKKGQKEARDYFKQLMFDIENNNYDKNKNEPRKLSPKYISKSKEVVHDSSKQIALVSCYDQNDSNMIEMIKEFKAKCPYEVKEYNIYNFKFSGGCLGCFSCVHTGHCVYKDGFEELLRDEIQTKDAIIHAFPIKNHYSYSQYKFYDDRQFCNGHRTVTSGTPIGFILSGDYHHEANLQTIIEGRCEVGGTYLTHIALDEQDAEREIDILVKNLCFALENHPTRPQNFYGVGGTRIFRDLVYEMRGLMRADHKYYKKTGVYKSLPQRHFKRLIQMEFVGMLVHNKYLDRKLKGKMNKYIIAPYKKVINKVKDNKNE